MYHSVSSGTFEAKYVITTYRNLSNESQKEPKLVDKYNDHTRFCKHFCVFEENGQISLKFGKSRRAM